MKDWLITEVLPRRLQIRQLKQNNNQLRVQRQITEMDGLNTGSIDFKDTAVVCSLTSENFLNCYMTQIRIVEGYLTLPKDQETSSQVAHCDLQENLSQSESVKFMNDQKDDDYDFDSEPKKKVGYRKKRVKPAKEKLPHNKHTQIFTKLMICFRKLKSQFSIRDQIFKMKPNKQKGLELILKDETLFEALSYIFENNMLVEEIIRGKANAPQKQENIKEANKMKERFKDFTLRATI